MSPRRETCARHAIEFERATPCLLCLSELASGRQARTAAQILARPLPFFHGALADAPGLAIGADKHDDVSNAGPFLAGVGDAAGLAVLFVNHPVGARRQA